MKCRVYCLEGDRKAKKIIGRDIEITKSDLESFDGYSPVTPSLKERYGLVGIWNVRSTIHKDLYVEVINELFDKEFTIRKSFVSFVSIKKELLTPTANTITAREALDITEEYIERVREMGAPAIYNSLLEVMGLLVRDDYSIRNTSSYAIICKKAHGMIFTDMAGSKVQVIYQNGVPIVFHDGRKVGWETLHLTGVTVAPVMSTKIFIDNQPLFNVQGKVNLVKLRQPSRVTKPWLNSTADYLGVNISGLEQEKALDKLYEHINIMAENVDFRIDKPYYLLTKEFIEKAPVTEHRDKGIDHMISLDWAISLMARRQGHIILPGNPNFNEATLRDNAEWYIAELISPE